MSLWTKITWAVRGKSDTSPTESSSQLIDGLHESVASSKQIKHELRTIRQSGIWPQDLIRGTYRVNRRKVRHDHP